MVAESPETIVERSLVAIPTTGSDRAAKPFVMDLGNLSTEASSVAIDPTVPSPEKFPLLEQFGYKGSKSRPTGPPKVNLKPQGPRIVSLKPGDVKFVVVKGVKRLTPPGSVQVQAPVLQSAMNQLLEERDRLMRENSGLARKLVQFERLLQRKKALGSCS